jgi:thymidylate synthase (FAD)
MENGNLIKVLDHGFVRYIDHMGSDLDILEAARVSYKSPSKGDEQDKKLLEYLYKNMHTSPFEMVKVKFNVKLPIFVMRQWVRHRMQNLNEVSARYTDLPNEFYIPKEWRKQDAKNKQGSSDEFLFNFPDGDSIYEVVSNHINHAYGLYEELLSNGVAREMARMVLPVNIYTECYSCWDLKNLLHFIALREDSHAQAEIQEYAKAMKEILIYLFPWTMSVFDKYKHKLVEV